MTGVNVLIVEDEGVLAMELTEKLEKLGYHVPGTASSGEKAIELAEMHKPDLILMDIVLDGEMDGIDAANRIRSKLKVPIIYLTAYADDETVKRAKITEPFGYLVKPYSDKELQIAIEMALYRNKMDKLRESHNWLEAVLRSIGDAVVATDKEGFITFINPSAEMLLGLKHNVLGKNFDEAIKIIDEETWTPVNHLVKRTLSENSTITSKGSKLLNKADGKEVPVDYVAAPIADAHGDIMGIVLILKDQTPQRDAEIASRIRDITMASSINALCITDLNGCIKYANAPFCRLWGYEAEGVLGKLISETCLTDPMLTEVYDSIRDIGKWIGEAEARREDGMKFFLKLSVNNVCDRLGRPIYVAYSFIDITDLKRAQEELKKYINELNKTDAKTDELAVDLSTNLKSCFEKISELYDFLSKDSSEDSEAAKYLAEIRESIDLVCGMIEELELCSLPYSLYISLIALYQQKVEDFGKNMDGK